MNFGFADPWHLFLPREAGHVVALMGSGGKTTLMRTLADVYLAEGIPVVLTTTTRSEVLAGVPERTYADLAAGTGDDLPDLVFVHRGPADQNKWQGLSPAEVDELGGLLPERVVLVEVDGAAKRPLKLHRQGEPVWPARTSLGVVVMGTLAVGSPTAEVLHRYGRVDWPPVAELEAWSIWEWDHCLALLAEAGGYLDRVPAEIPCVLALTGMDEQPDSVGLFDFVGRAMADPRLPLAMFCDLAADPPVIRTAFQLDEDAS